MSFIERSENKFSPLKRQPPQLPRQQQQLQESPRRNNNGSSVKKTLYTDFTNFRSDIKRKLGGNQQQSSPLRLSTASKNLQSQQSQQQNKTPNLLTAKSRQGLDSLQKELFEMSQTTSQKKNQQLLAHSLLSPQQQQNQNQSRQQYQSQSQQQQYNNNQQQQQQQQLNNSQYQQQQNTSFRLSYNNNKVSSSSNLDTFQKKYSSQIKRGTQANITSFQRPPISSNNLRQQYSPQRNASPQRINSSGQTFRQQSPKREYMNAQIRSISPRKRLNNQSLQVLPNNNNNTTGSFLSQQQQQFRQNLSVLNNSTQQQLQQQFTHNTSNQVNQNISQLLEETRIKNKDTSVHKNYRDLVRNKGVEGIIPIHRIQELQDVLVDAQDSDFNLLNRQYIEELIKLSSVIMFRVKSSTYYKRTL